MSSAAATRSHAPVGRTSLDFNGILNVANLLVQCLAIWAYVHSGDNEYVDLETIALGVLLAVQTNIALLIERRNRDPFVIILAFTLIVYYSFRICTLTLFPFSNVFPRYPYDAHDSNYALTFIIVANVALYLGFFSVRRVGDAAVRVDEWTARAPARVIALMAVAIVLAYFSRGGAEGAGVPTIVGFLTIFISQNIVILMALTYFFLFRTSLSRGATVAIATLVVADMVLHTLMGSRGAIAGFLQEAIIATLAIYGRIRLPGKSLGLIVALLPALLVAVVVSFTVSTFNRANRDGTLALDLPRALELAQVAGSDLSFGASLDVVLPPIFARAGFFDYSAEIIAHRERYASVLNLAAYARSIVDNVLTPGFDVYDQPKIANSLQFVYADMGLPSKAAVTDAYQSDQIGIYGESYALLGYAALPLLFATAYFLKRMYARVRGASPFDVAMKRVVVLFVFARTVDSFGADWTIIETLELIVAVLIYRFFFAAKLIRPLEAAPSVRVRPA